MFGVSQIVTSIPRRGMRFMPDYEQSDDQFIDIDIQVLSQDTSIKIITEV